MKSTATGDRLVEVPLEPGAVLIGDLHLDVSPTASAQARAERPVGGGRRWGGCRDYRSGSGQRV